MKITVLIENESNSKLACEHGLSLWIETAHKRILLDAGKTGAAMENAKQLGISIEKADFCVLSHGHYDHADGFLRILEECPNLMVYTNSGVIKEYYSCREGKIRYIGVDKRIFSQYRNHFSFINQTTEISKDVYLIIHEPSDYKKRAEHACLYMGAINNLIPDDFLHEMTLVIREAGELYVFNSCSHIGVAQVIREVRNIFIREPIAAFIGGFHFLGKEPGKCSYTEREVKLLAHRLIDTDVKKVYTGHCTGREGFQWLQEVLEDRIIEIHSGTVCLEIRN